MQFNGIGKPTGLLKAITLSDSVQTIKTTVLGAEFTHILLQCRAAGAAYTNTREVAFYTVDGTTDPTTAIGQTLGDGDYRLFTRNEADKGIRLISGQAGIAGKIHYQLYLGDS